jgi:S1-C subfamily serine protease
MTSPSVTLRFFGSLILLLAVWINSGTAFARTLDQSELRTLTEQAQTDPKVAKQLAYRYIKGQGVPKDVAKGLFYLEKAVDLGDTEALNFLKKIYSNKKSALYNPGKLRALLQSASSTETRPVAWEGSRKLIQGLDEKKIFPDGGQGSAFALNDEGVFVSNAHVTGHCSWTLVRYNEQFAIGRPIAKDKKRDLSLIKVDHETPYFLNIRADNILVGEAVSVGGYPYTPGLFEYVVDFSLSVGVVGRFRKTGGVGHIQVSAPVASGNSGGPAIDNTGALIGVAVAKIASGESEQKPC